MGSIPTIAPNTFHEKLEDLTGFCLLDESISDDKKREMLGNYQNLIMEDLKCFHACFFVKFKNLVLFFIVYF